MWLDLCPPHGLVLFRHNLRMVCHFILSLGPVNTISRKVISPGSNDNLVATTELVVSPYLQAVALHSKSPSLDIEHGAGLLPDPCVRGSATGNFLVRAKEGTAAAQGWAAGCDAAFSTQSEPTLGTGLLFEDDIQY